MIARYMKYFKETAFLLALMTLAVACRKDDDTDPQQPTDAELEARYERMDMERFAVMDLLSHLADVSFDVDFEDDIDFEGQTYEPAIGEVRDKANPLERSIFVNDASESEERFRELVNGNAFIRETSDGCIIDLSNLDCREDGRKQNFGTLTFHRGGDSNNSGYADVNIPCIPHLERISYKTEAQWGDNAGFRSPCTYGDVYIGEGVYWICVREARSSQTKGVLVNVEPGYGTLHKILWDANFEPDNDHFPTVQDIKDYLLLCADEYMADQKERIIRLRDNKVFPRLCSNHSTSSFSFTTGKGDYGFAHTREGYSFYASEGIGKDKKNGAIIIYDAKKGGKKYKIAGSRKRYEYFLRIPFQCERDEGAKEDSYSSYGDGGFYELYSNNWTYICNAKYFTTQVPKGFILDPDI